MAIVTYKNTLQPYLYLGDLFQPNDTAKIVSRAATLLRYNNDDGTTVNLTGSGFLYDAGIPVDGTVTRIEVRQGATVLLTITGVSLELYDAFYDLFGWDRAGQPRQDGDGFNFMSNVLSGNDTIVGSSLGDDILAGTNEGNDTIDGNGGDDFIKGDRGNDTIDGGDGFDVLSYDETHFGHGSFRGIVLDAVAKTVTDSWNNADTFDNIEEFRGSRFNDVIRGSAADDFFMGFRGSDTLDGRDGFDYARYNEDARFGGLKGIDANFATGKVRDGFGSIDTIVSIEFVEGTDFADKYTGANAGKESGIYAGQGIDSYKGGAGFDEIDLGGNQAVVLDLTLAAGQIVNDGFGNTETFTGVVEAFFGGNANDRLTGGTREDRLRGQGGNDIILGGAGDDNIRGGAGIDNMTGGTGDDDFFWRRQSDGFANDRINDFVSGDDQIGFNWQEFAGMDGTVRFNNGAAAAGAGSSFFFNAAQHKLYWDADGTGAQAAVAVVTLIGVGAMAAGDILLV